MLKLKKIEKQAELIEYSRVKSLNHKVYKRYAPEYLTKNVNNFIFTLSDGKVDDNVWEDIRDYKSLRNFKQKVFVACFCCQKTENVSFWKTYGDYMLSLNNKQFKSIFNNINEIILSKGYEFNRSDEIVLKSNQFNIEVYDAIYYEDRKNNVVLSHQEEHENKPKNIINNLPPILKHYAFYNERECRVMLTIKGDKSKYKDYHVARFSYKPGIITKENITTSPAIDPIKGYKVSELKGYVKWK